jgi:hypothetical protein
MTELPAANQREKQVSPADWTREQAAHCLGEFLSFQMRVYGTGVVETIEGEGLGPDELHIYTVTDGNFFGSGVTKVEAAAAFLAGYGYNPDGSRWAEVSVPPTNPRLIERLLEGRCRGSS